MYQTIFSFILIIVFSWNRTYAQDGICTKADTLFAQQEYFLAADAYRGCYDRDTTDKTSLSALATCLYILGDYQQAKLYFHQLEQHADHSSEAVIKLAAIYDAQQNLPKAIKYNILLTKTFPNNPMYFRKLGSLYHQGNEPTQAIQSYSAAISLNPRDMLSIQGLADMMLGLDELHIADSLLVHGLVIDSTHIGLSLLLARVRYRMRDYSGVANILHKLTYQTELNNYYNKLLGYAFLQIDSLDKSIYHLQKSLLNEGDPEYAQFYLGLAYEKKLEMEKSDYFFKKAIKSGISENLDQYYRGLARINTHKGDYKTVIENYKSSLQYSNDASIYFYMANAAEQYYKDKSKAIGYYQQFLNAKPTDKKQIDFAKQRLSLLKEQRFMRGNDK
jgi:tetratricopeptide (TPR) repeat protein